MKTIKKWNENSFVFITIFMCLLGAFFILNYFTTYIADDFNYMFVFGIDEDVRVHNVKDIFVSQVNHYKINGGRWLAHTLAQTYLMFGKEVFNILHTCFYGLYLILIYKIVRENNRSNAVLILAIAALLWIFTPRWGQCFLWLTGSCNYFYTSLICLLGIWFLKRIYFKETEVTPFFAISVGVTSFLAGGGNELLAVAYCGITITMAVVGRKNKNAWLNYIIVVCAMIGFCIMFFAPGNFNRFYGGESASLFITIFKLVKNSVRNIYMIIMNVWPAIINFILSVWISRRLNVSSKRIKFSMILGVWAILGLFALTIAEGGFSERSSFGAVALLIVASLLNYTAISLDRIMKEILECLCIAGIACIIFISVQYVQTLIDTQKIYHKYYAREKYIEEMHKEGVRTITYPQIKGTYSHVALYGLEDLRYDYGTSWPNNWIARYYGLDEIYAVTEYMWQKNGGAQK